MYQITVTTSKCTRKTKWNFWNNLLNLLHTHTHTWIWIFNRCKHKAPLDSTAGNKWMQKYSMIQFSFHSFTGIKYNLGSYAFFTLRKFVARFKLFSVLFLRYIGDSWNPVVSYRLQSKNITWGALRLFFWENFCPYKGTPQESNLASGPCSQTGQISLHTQNLCTKNHSPRNSRQHFSKCRQRS